MEEENKDQRYCINLESFTSAVIDSDFLNDSDEENELEQKIAYENMMEEKFNSSLLSNRIENSQILHENNANY